MITIIHRENVICAEKYPLTPCFVLSLSGLRTDFSIVVKFSALYLPSEMATEALPYGASYL